MELNYHNFQQEMLRLDDNLSSCEFFAVDFEFTGLDRAHESSVPRITRDSTSEEVERCARQAMTEMTTLPATTYAQKAAVCGLYSVMQVGVALFRPLNKQEEDEISENYVHRGLCYLAQRYGPEGFAPLAPVLPKALRPLCRRSETNPSESISFVQQVQAALAENAATWSPDSADTKALLTTLLTVEVPRLELVATEKAEQVPSLPSAAAASQLSEEQCVARFAQILEALDAHYELQMTMDLVRLLAGWLTKTCTLGATCTTRSSSTDEMNNDQRTSESFTVQTYSAFLFPSHHSVLFADMMLNAETVGQFLTDNSTLDFNKWVRGGLRFMAADEYLVSADLKQSRELAVKQLQSMVAQTATTGADGTCDADSASTYSSLFGSSLKPLEPLSEAEKTYVNFVKTADVDPITQKKLATQAVMLFNFLRDTTAVETPPDSVFFVREPFFANYRDALKRLGVEKCKTVGKLCFVKAQQNTVKVAHGAALLLRLVAASRREGKPIIFHNGYTDLMFFVKTVFGYLPPTLEGFKQMVQTLFPHLYDTRTLASVPVLQRLGNLRGTLANSHQMFAKKYETTVTLVREDVSSAGNHGEAAEGADSLHDAGYDAFLTGSLFLYERRCLQQYAAASSSSSAPTPLQAWELVLPLYSSCLCANLRAHAPEVLPQHPLLPILVVLIDMFRFPSELRQYLKDEKKCIPLSIVPRKGVGYVCQISPTRYGQSEAELKELAEESVKVVKKFCATLIVRKKVSPSGQSSVDYAFVVPFSPTTLLKGDSIKCIY